MNMMIIIGIAAAAVIRQVLGMIWYSPSVCGDAWIRLSGITFNPQDPTMHKKMIRAIIGSFINSILIASVMVCFITRMHIDSALSGLLFGLTVWLGFVVTHTVNGVLYEQRPWGWFYVHTGYEIISLACMGAVLPWFLQ